MLLAEQGCGLVSPGLGQLGALGAANARLAARRRRAGLAELAFNHAYLGAAAGLAFTLVSTPVRLERVP